MKALQDDLQPLDPREGTAQLAQVRALVAPSARVVDLGAGSGRIARPLAQAGCEVLAVESDPSALANGAWTRERGIEPLEEDALQTGATWFTRGPFDAALCLGNTLSLFLRNEQLELLFARIASALRSGGLLLIDDFPIWGWEAVDAGEWPSGISEDAEAQLIWVPGEPIFAFRRGAEVDPDSDHPLPGERLLRLWSLSELTLLAREHGLSAPLHRPEGLLIQFERV